MMTELQDDLRSTAEAIIRDAERIKRIEQEKAETPVEDERTAELAQEAETVARRLLSEAVAERELAADAREAAGDRLDREGS